MSRRFRYDPATDSVVEVGKPAAVTQDWKQLHSEAMAFDGSEQEAKRIDAMVGAPPVDYDKLGRPVFNDRSTYDKYLKAHGYVNKTSGKCQVISGADLQRAMERAKTVDKIGGEAPKSRREKALERLNDKKA